MAVAAGIIDQIVLMLCLGRIEVAQRLDQHGGPAGIAVHQLFERGDEYGFLGVVGEEHASAVLSAAVFALLVHGERVDDL